VAAELFPLDGLGVLVAGCSPNSGGASEFCAVLVRADRGREGVAAVGGSSVTVSVVAVAAGR